MALAPGLGCVIVSLIWFWVRAQLGMPVNTPLFDPQYFAFGDGLATIIGIGGIVYLTFAVKRCGFLESDRKRARMVGFGECPVYGKMTAVRTKRQLHYRLTGEPGDIAYFYKCINPECDFVREIGSVSPDEDDFDDDVVENNW